MNKKARNELIRVIIGLVMIAAGVGLFISKTSVSTELLSFGGVYSWWISVLVILPLAAGIVMLIVKPHLMASKIVAIAGAVVIVTAILINTTIIIEKDISTFEWIIYGVLLLGGIIVCLSALFIKKRIK